MSAGAYIKGEFRTRGADLEGALAAGARRGADPAAPGAARRHPQAERPPRAGQARAHLLRPRALLRRARRGERSIRRLAQGARPPPGRPRGLLPRELPAVRDRLLRGAEGRGDQRLLEPDAQGGRAPARARRLGRPRPRHLRPGLRRRGADPRQIAARGGRRHRLPRLPAGTADAPAAALLPRAPARVLRHGGLPHGSRQLTAARDARTARARRHRAPPVHLGHDRRPEGRRADPWQPRRELRADAPLARPDPRRPGVRRRAVVPHHRHGSAAEHDGVRRLDLRGTRALRPGRRAPRDPGLPLHADDPHRDDQRGDREFSDDARVRSLLAPPVSLRRRAGDRRRSRDAGRRSPATRSSRATASPRPRPQRTAIPRTARATGRSASRSPSPTSRS